jgi:hypothetical protein
MTFNIQKAFITLLFICVTSSAIAQGTKPGGQKNDATDSEQIYFNANAREVVQPATTTSDKLSATSIGDDLSVLFDNAKLSLQTESDPLSGSWVTTIVVPTNASVKKRTSYLQRVRGAVMKSEGSRVSLILSFGGKTLIKEYPYGMKSNGDFLLTFVSPIKPLAAARYIATILILVERRDSKSAVLVNVDSLDVQAKAAKKSSTK